MKSRRVDDDTGKVLVENMHTGDWEEIPKHIGVYTLGFPCTPWSMQLRQHLSHSIPFPNCMPGPTCVDNRDHITLPLKSTLAEERPWKGLGGQEQCAIFCRDRDGEAGAAFSIHFGMCFLAATSCLQKQVSSPLLSEAKVEGMTNRSSTADGECSSDDRNDLEKAIDYIKKELSEWYDISIFRNQKAL